MNKAFLDYYHCPEMYGEFCLQGTTSSPAGYFRFGLGAIVYGQIFSGPCVASASGQLYDAMDGVEISNSIPSLPFDPTCIVDNLRFERYLKEKISGNWNRRLK